MPIGSQVIYNAGDLILSTVSSSGNTFVETKIAAATSSVILFNNSANLTSASLSSLTVGNAISSSYALTASFSLNAGGGSGTVSGSTNYIAKFTSATAIGTSSIYETGSNVGIGTTDPQYKLDVRPAGANARIGIAELGAWPASSTFAYFQHSLLNNLDGGNYALVQSSAGETFLNAASGQVLHFRINNGEVGQFNSSGYLGIGHNNNPITAKLEVSGSTGEYLFNVKSTSTPYTLFASGSGRVGIGTNVLPNKLTIDGNVTASSYTSSIINAVGFLGTASYALTASAVSIVPSNVFVQGGNSFGTTATLGTNDASALILETNGSGRVTIDTNGYVGIAQPTPTAYLHVGQSAASDTNNYGIRIDKNGTLGSPGSYQNSAIYISDLASDGPSTVDVTGQVSFNFPRLQASDTSASKVSHLIIAHDSALGPMRVDGKGNLWVGYDRSLANTSSNSFSTLIYGGLTVGASYQTTTVSDGTAIFAGNVGIGTYSPQFLLDVSGSSRHGVISSNVHQFTGSVNINGSLFSNANITASNISASGTGSFGIVGIGTTSPAAKLAVGSSPTYAAGVALIVGTPGNPSTSGTSQPYANLRLGTNTGNSQVLDFGIYDASPYGSWIQAAGGGNLAFPSPLVLNPTGGSLGIGTSNPVATLDIENAVANIPVLNLGGGIGGENVSDLYVLNSYNANTGVGFSAKVIGVNISGSLTAQNIPVQRTVWSGVTSATAIVLGADGPRQGTQDNAFQIWTTSEGTSGSLLTQKFSLTSTGDVGIGTTAPAYLLDVSGSSRHGYRAADTHQFTGSVSLSDGLSLTNLTASNISASGYIIASKITASNAFINGNLTVTGSIFASLFSASYIYITSSTLVVTDNILTLNALSPYQRYAGIEMYDSGSGNLSSFLWDGQGDYFFVTGSGVNSKIIVGPDQQTNLTSGRLTKATGTNIIGDSIVSDNGSGIIVSGYISGSSVITGNITASNISASGTGSFGAVGIGTTTLGEKLTVSGNSYIIGSTGAVGTGLAYYLGDSSNRDISLTRVGTAALAIGRYYPSAWAETVRFTADGNVGIGTTNPVSKVHISGSGQTIMRLDSDTTTNVSQFQIKAASDAVLIMGMQGGSAASTNFGVTAAGQAYFGTTTLGSPHPTSLVIGNVIDIPIVFANNNTERMRIAADGYVGIGTTSPAGKLHIVQNNDVGRYSYFGSNSGLFIKANDNSINNLLVLENTEPGTNYGVSINFNLGYGGDQTTAGTAIQGSKIVTAQEQTWTSTSSTQDAFLAFYTALNGTSGEKVRITSDGNVGIGVTNPSGRLHITASATNGESLVYLSKGSGSITQYYINAVNQNGAVNYRLSSDINGHAQQTLYLAGTAHVYHDSFWSSYINNANYTQGGLGIGTTSLTHGYGVTIAKPATSGSLYVSGSSVFTGSVSVSGSVTFAGPIIYDNAVLLDFGRTTTPATSTNYVVLQNITGSYNAAFFDYFASSASNFRAGTVIAGWSGSGINYTEYATTDTGNTNQLTMSVDLSSSFIRLLTTVSTTTNWNIKSSGRYL